MDFIEKVFHIAPDGGTGVTELAFFIVLVLAMGLVVRRREQKHARKR
ncbi:MAG: hypothetical protein ABSF28_03770 [Terracidiphilus sp.]|jgi:hypothetical protein